MNGKISLHDLKSGKRLTQNGSCNDVKFLYLNPWRTQFLPRLKTARKASPPWVSLRVGS